MSQTSADSGPRTLASALVERLRADIVGGALGPGEKLRLPELSDRYECGVNPLREALARLSATGLVTIEDQKGFRVSPVSREDLIDITRTRQQIESLVLRQSIAEGDVEWETRVLSAHHRLMRMSPTVQDRPGELSDEWEAHHQAFHFALVSGAESRWLLHFHDVLAEQTVRYRRLMVTARFTTRDVPAEHAQLVEAVLARDADRACELIAAHFARTTEIVLTIGNSSNTG